uniref:Moricin-like peptide D n=1 Tax=Galleria mellonella TaxID=7137 RepID=A5JSV2_GALME|nr:moricin-like peptide D [Galleria mellonella]
MKFFNLVLMVFAVVALMLNGTNAEPKGIGSALKKGGKIIKGGLGALGAIGTGQQVYEHVQNRQ